MSFSDSLLNFQDFLQSVRDKNYQEVPENNITKEEKIFTLKYSKNISNVFDDIDSDTLNLLSMIKYNKIKHGVTYPEFIETIISQIDNSITK